MSEEKAEPKRPRPESTSYPLLRVLADVWQSLLVLFLVWFLGAFGFSIIWLLVAFVMYVWRTQAQRARELRHRMRAAIAKDEKAFLATVEDLPSWVYFPDKEKAEWLNNILKQMWPFINDYVSDLLQTKIGPSIANAMPGPFKGFRFLNTDLGDVAPRIGGVKVYTEQLQRDEVIMDMEIFYAGDCHIQVTVGKKLNAGVSDLTISGTLRVVFSPLLKQMPLIGAVQAFFLNRPYIDFNLKSLANAFDVPGLSDILRKIATDQVAAIMVLPNKIKVPLVKDIDPDRFTYVLPKSLLRVCVINAKELKRTDISVIGKGTSDPFVVLRVGAEEYKTKVQKKTVDPIWNEWFEFILDTSPFGRQVEFEVYDHDATDKNDKLGTMDVDLEQVAKTGALDSWMPLEGVDKGRLHVSAELLLLSDDPSKLDKEGTAPRAEEQIAAASQRLDDRQLASCIVSVKLDGAKCLPTPSKSLSEPNPMAVVRVGNDRQESCVKQDTSNPRWEQHFLFRCRNVAMQDVDVEIFDKRKGKKVLGRLSVALRGVVGYPGMSTLQWYPLKNSGPDSQLHLGLCVRALVPSDGEEPPDLSDMAVLPLVSALQGPTALEEGEAEELVGNSKPDSFTVEDETGAGGSVAVVNPQQAENKINGSTREDVDSITKGSELRRRLQEPNKRQTTEVGKAFGRLQLTLRYSAQRQRLVLVVHQCKNLMPCDSNHLADPYVRVYLLPDKSHKEKTQIRKDTLNPVFDETFEFAVSSKELSSRTLQINVKNKNSFFSKARKEMGEVCVSLNQLADAEGIKTEWYDLENPDGKED